MVLLLLVLVLLDGGAAVAVAANTGRRRGTVAVLGGGEGEGAYLSLGLAVVRAVPIEFFLRCVVRFCIQRLLLRSAKPDRF